MKIVLDTNILISALIKDSITRKIIFESNSEFYYPETSLHELRKHKNFEFLQLDLTKHTELEKLPKKYDIKYIKNMAISRRAC